MVLSDFKNHLDATPDGDGEGDEDKEVRGEGDDGGHAAVLLKGIEIKQYLRSERMGHVSSKEWQCSSWIKMLLVFVLQFEACKTFFFTKDNVDYHDFYVI